MSGRTNATVEYIAGLLKSGYEARVVGDEPLRGVTADFIEVDGQIVPVPRRQTSQPGIILTGRATIFVATVSRDRAQHLLASAAPLAPETQNEGEK